MIEPRTVLEPRRDVRFRRVPPETVVVRQEAAEVLVLNGVAGRVLELCDGRRPLSGVVDALLAEYDVERGDLERDVLRFASELLDAGVAEEVAVAR